MQPEDWFWLIVGSWGLLLFLVLLAIYLWGDDW